jgi:hypothetical protein
MKHMNYLTTMARRTKNSLVLLAFTGFLTVHGTADVSLPELMEQGVYSEETKGDLDAALKIYRQVVAEAKTGQSVAAQAQYRMGVCLYKKKNYTEATAAFEKLVKEYPDLKELVTLANKYLSGTILLLPEPWADGEDMQMDIKFPSGFKIGMASYRIHSGELGGRKIWRVSSCLYAAAPSVSQVEVEMDSFKPIHGRWKHAVIGDAEAAYSPTTVEVKCKGKAEPVKVDLDGPVFDNEEVIQLMRRLPLTPGYTLALRCLTSLGGGNIIPIKLTVPGVETVEVAAGKFECHKVELNLVTGKQTFWYSTDTHRYLVKFEAGGAIAELTGVNVHKAGEPANYTDPAFHFSLAAPSEWAFFRAQTKSDKDKALVTILNPDALGDCTLAVWTETPKPGDKMSMREWAKQQLAQADEIHKNDGTVRADSWVERTLAGRPAVGFIADLEENKEKQVVYTVYGMVDTMGVKFRMVLPADAFEAMKPKLDSIIDSLKMN